MEKSQTCDSAIGKEMPHSDKGDRVDSTFFGCFFLSTNK